MGFSVNCYLYSYVWTNRTGSTQRITITDNGVSYVLNHNDLDGDGRIVFVTIFENMIVPTSYHLTGGTFTTNIQKIDNLGNVTADATFPAITDMGPSLITFFEQTYENPGIQGSGNLTLNGTSPVKWTFQYQVTFTADPIVKEEEDGIILIEQQMKIDELANDLIDKVEEVMEEASDKRLLGQGEMENWNGEEEIEVNLDPYNELGRANAQAFEEMPFQRMDMEGDVYAGMGNGRVQPFSAALAELTLMAYIGKDSQIKIKPQSQNKIDQMNVELFNRMKKAREQQSQDQPKLLLGEGIYQTREAKRPQSIFASAGAVGEGEGNNQIPGEYTVGDWSAKDIQNRINSPEQTFMKEMVGTDFTEKHIEEIKSKYFTSQNIEHQLQNRLRSSMDLSGETEQRVAPREVLAMKTVLGDLDLRTQDDKLHYKLRDILQSDDTKSLYQIFSVVPDLFVKAYEVRNRNWALDPVGYFGDMIKGAGVETQYRVEKRKYEKLLSEVQQIVSLPHNELSTLSYEVKHFGVRNFDGLSLPQVKLKIQELKAIQSETFQRDYGHLKGADEVYEPFLKLAEVRDYGTQHWSNFDKVTTAVLGVIASFMMGGIGYQFNQRAANAGGYAIAAGQLGGEVFGDVAILGDNMGNQIMEVGQDAVAALLGDGFIDGIGNILLGAGPYVQQAAQALQVIQQMQMVMPAFNVPIGQFLGNLGNQLQAYGQNQAVDYFNRLAQNQVQNMLGIRIPQGVQNAMNIGNAVMNMANLDGNGALDLLANGVPNINVNQIVADAAQNMMGQVLGDVLGDGFIGGAEDALLLQPVNDMNMDNIMQLVPDRVRDIVQDQAQQFIGPENMAFINDLGERAGINLGPAEKIAAIVAVAAAGTIYKAWSDYSEGSSSADPKGVLDLIDKKMERTEIPIYGSQDKRFRKAIKDNKKLKQQAIILDIVEQLMQEPKVKEGKRLYPHRIGKPVYQPNKRRKLDDSREMVHPEVFKELKKRNIL